MLNPNFEECTADKRLFGPGRKETGKVKISMAINYFFGVNGEVGPGELGAAIGTSGGQLENQTQEAMVEVYYSYELNDGMTITPLVFVKEKATAGTPDQTGVMVKTTFKF